MLFQHGNDCILFTADAGVPALEQAIGQLEVIGFDFNRLRIVQVPHHGSKRNVGPKILDRILGPKRTDDAILRGRSCRPLRMASRSIHRNAS